jgi:hypothetical protein
MVFFGHSPSWVKRGLGGVKKEKRSNSRRVAPVKKMLFIIRAVSS